MQSCTHCNIVGLSTYQGAQFIREVVPLHLIVLDVSTTVVLIELATLAATVR